MDIPELLAPLPDTRWEVLHVGEVDDVAIGYDGRSEPFLYITDDQKDVYRFGGWALDFQKVGSEANQLVAMESAAEIFQLDTSGSSSSKLRRYDLQTSSWTTLFTDFSGSVEALVIGGQQLYLIDEDTDTIYRKRDSSGFFEWFITKYAITTDANFADNEPAYWDEIVRPGSQHVVDAQGVLYLQDAGAVWAYDPAQKTWIDYGSLKSAVDHLVVSQSNVYALVGETVYSTPVAIAATPPSWSIVKEGVQSVHVDAEDHLYVVDSLSSQAQRYDAQTNQWQVISGPVEEIFVGGKDRVYALPKAPGVAGLMRFRDTLKAQTRFKPLPPVQTKSPPDLTSTGVLLFAAVVKDDGTIALNSTYQPQGWQSDWSDVTPSGPVVLADPDSPPVLLDAPTIVPQKVGADVKTKTPWLFLFFRGQDGNLYTSNIYHTTGKWQQWQQLPSLQKVQGDIAVALVTTENAGLQPETVDVHLAFPTQNDQIVYQHYQGQIHKYEFSLVSEGTWSGAETAQIVSDDLDTVWAVVETTTPNHFDFYRRDGKKDEAWKAVQSMTFTGEVKDVSNPVVYRNNLHVLVTVHINNLETLVHLEVSDSGIQKQAVVITSPLPMSDFTQASLVVYRNKLVSLYKGPDGFVRYARMDNAHPKSPWLGREVLDGGVQIQGRPIVSSHSGKESLFLNIPVELSLDEKNDQYFSGDNFARDIMAIGVSKETGQIEFLNASRAFFQHEVDAQFRAFSYSGDQALTNVWNVGSDISAVDRLDLDGRPYVTELGFSRWLLPHDRLGDYAQYQQGLCEAFEQSPTPRKWYEPNCDDSRTPVVVKMGTTEIPPHTNSDFEAIFIPPGSNSIGIMHELEHIRFDSWLDFSGQGFVGIEDQFSCTTGYVFPKNLALSGISEQGMMDGYLIFGAGLLDCGGSAGVSCPPPTERLTGFTDAQPSYQSRGHSFIFTLMKYVADGNQLRGWIDEDLEVGNDLLQQKYDWIKTHIFDGVEFGEGLEPRAIGFL